MDARRVARALELGRVGMGFGLLAAPGKVGAGWIGPEAELSSTKVFARAFGARDLALALGALHALRDGRSAGPWLWAGVLSDAADLVATLAAGRSLPPVGRAAGVAVAGGVTVAGVWLARELG